ncbi:putative holin-like toxin [Sporosarcina saromensis]|uniref:Holin-like toxin n=1 Tax=Sporosarcina saromensis TaxID=359365 RepID=A0ABU4GDM0_9BACL|nr:putative holin-like toxin [Sporosarcina saromensis]MDW0115074.1 putative holin-like toxin [Sporosarcina saromensis]
MTVFQALMVALTFGLLIVAMLSFGKNKPLGLLDGSKGAYFPSEIS